VKELREEKVSHLRRFRTFRTQIWDFQSDSLSGPISETQVALLDASINNVGLEERMLLEDPKNHPNEEETIQKNKKKRAIDQSAA